MAQKIIVGCRLPHGLNATVEGVSVSFVGASRGVKSEEGVFTPFGVNSCGITRGVDADWFSKFLHIYADAPYVQKGFIFPIKSGNDIQDATAERKKEKTGLEAISPANGAPKDGQVTTDLGE